MKHDHETPKSKESDPNCCLADDSPDGTPAKRCKSTCETLQIPQHTGLTLQPLAEEQKKGAGGSVTCARGGRCDRARAVIFWL